MSNTDTTEAPAAASTASPSFFSLLESELKSCAVSVLAKIEAEGKVIVQVIEPIAENAFAQAVAQFRTLATETVVNLMTEAGAALSGDEKANLAVTTLLDHAEQTGIALAESDASALVKNAFLAVTEVLAGKANG